MAKNRFILFYLVWVIFGGALLWIGFGSIMRSSSWYPSFLVYFDELMVVAGAVLLVLSLFWFKKHWSEF